MVVYLVDDLLFVSKIRETAQTLGVAATRVKDARALAQEARSARVVLLDLRLGRAFEALELLAADPATANLLSVGFVDHERVDLMEQARQKGCKTVLTKGKFSSDLAALLGAARDPQVA